MFDHYRLLLYYMFMNPLTSPDLDMGIPGSSDDCLLDLVETADIASGQLEDHPGLVEAFEKHITIVTDEVDMSIEQQCLSCPVMCTWKSIDGHATYLVSNPEDCLKQK